MSIGSAYVGNSTTYQIGNAINSIDGGISNSSTYELRFTEHYQQPVGEFNSTTYDGDLRWLGNPFNIFLLTHFIIQEQTCYDNNTLEVVTYFRYNNVDTPISVEYIPCDLGCSKNVCIMITQEISYSYIGMATLILTILFFLFTYALSKTEILRLFSISLAIFITIITLSLATIPGGLTDNAIIQSIYGASSSIYAISTIVALALILFTFIFIIMSIRMTKQAKQYGLLEDEENG